jgi:hypothetical protein
VLTDRAIAIELDGERGALDAFSVLDDVVDAARVAYLVEMDHFIAEKYDFRLLCMRYLASRGWTWFGEEIDWRVGERVDRYLATGDDSLLDPIDEPPWYATGVLADATARHPKAAHDAAQRRFAQSVRRAVPGARWFGFDIGGADVDYLALANAATTFEDLVPAMALREQKIQARVERVLREHPDAKVALMAGSLHLMKDDDAVHAPGVTPPGGDGVRSVGHHVAHALGERVVSFWLLHGEGESANPWLPPPGRLAPAAGTFDAELLARVGAPCLVPVGDDHHRRSITQMHNAVLHTRLDTQVDAIVFAPRVTRLR